MNIEEIKRVYFVGIGGIGMSAVAGIAKSFDFEVSGSDKNVYSPAKEILEKEGIEYFTGYSEENAKNSKADLFVISAGEDTNNPEVKYIYDQGLRHCSFSEFLFEITKDKLRVVVAGTHGKSTTTGLLGHLLKNLDNSSFFTGAVLQNYNSNFYVGDGNYFVFEGDEYKAEWDDPTPKFHFYKPDILVLTNLEFDHPDVFESLESMEEEFRLLIAAMPEDGLIIYNADNPSLAKLVHESNISSASFGIDNEADYKVENISFDEDFTTVDVHNKFSKNISAHLLGQTEQYKLQLPGKINVYNALTALATLRALGFQQDQIQLDLLAYKGVKRRFEYVGTKNGITIIDDYAHHPTAVKETLEAAKLKYFGEGLKMKDNGSARLWAVFEPHTFSRTKATLNELSKSFDSADEVLISEIYPAREKAGSATIKSEEVVEAVRNSPHFRGGLPALGVRVGVRGGYDKRTRLVKDKQEALNIIKSEGKPGDVVVVMAVGNFNRLAYELKDLI